MKARTDCAKCREQIYNEVQKAYLKQEYKFFEDAAYSMAIFSVIAALAVHHRRNRSKKYIQEFFNEMCFMFDYPAYKGKQLSMLDAKNLFESKYEIDFSKIKLHLESEAEFVKSAQRGQNK
ncbi:MAG: hypothetical protein IKK91_11975 [Ruminococcus sp.]|nr:hypothetical protein [Ruminococcus sp.]